MIDGYEDASDFDGYTLAKLPHRELAIVAPWIMQDGKRQYIISQQFRNSKGLPYGDGCTGHPHCETCPFPDCIAGYKGSYRYEFTLHHGREA